MNHILIAGAGTGKTFALMQAYIDYLKIYSISEMLAITFTQKAAEEMRTRIISKMHEKNILNQEIFSASICTFHAFCAKIIREHDGDFKLLSTYEDNKFSNKIAEEVILSELRHGNIKNLVARFGIHGPNHSNKGLSEFLISISKELREKDIKNPKLLLEDGKKKIELIEKILNLLQSFLNTAQDINLIKKLNSFLKMLNCLRLAISKSEHIWVPIFKNMRSIVFNCFEDKKLQLKLNAAIDELGSYLCIVHLGFDLILFNELLDRYRRSRDLYFLENKLFSFEDILWRASEILSKKDCKFRCVLVDEYQDNNPIQEKLIQCLGKNAELFLVGDPKQSIYGFRGASSSILENISGTHSYLTISQRSQGGIVEFVNLIMSSVYPNFNKNELLGSAKLHYGRAGGILKDGWIKQMQTLILEKHYKPSDFVILVRRIKAAIPLAAELQNYHIPVKIIGGSEFYTCQEIYDFAAALLILIEPNNVLAKFILMRSPFCNIPDTELINWKNYKLPNVFNVARKKLGNERLAKIIDFLLINTKYISEISKNKHREQKFANIFKLRTLLIDVLDEYEISIRDLWSKTDNLLNENLAAEFINEHKSAVRIMTIHQSKGLEFPIVILADLESAIPGNIDKICFDPVNGLAISPIGTLLEACCPSRPSEKKQFQMPIDKVKQFKRNSANNELYKLLYVAITRASEYLYIINNSDDEVNAQRSKNNLLDIIKIAKQKNEILFNKLMQNGFIFKSILKSKH